VDLLSSIKDHHSERRLFISRVILTSVVSFLLLSTVVARLVQLQVYDHEAFAAQSQGNRIRIEPVPPIRGLVFDRRGRVLAENLPAYQLELIPGKDTDPGMVVGLQEFAELRLGKGVVLSEDTPNFVANRMLAHTANLLYGLHITDEATCFKVIETGLLRSLHLECEGFEFCPEVTAKLGKRKIEIREVPIQYQAREVADGKKIHWTDGFEAMWVLLKQRASRK